ncbi:hypothetical protein ACWDT6_23935 [Nocardia grenadensis]|uniref:hypothetical protein n=1 Tax=Nocardia grenadensis TaxID=931537 RepID=UPI003D717267
MGIGGFIADVAVSTVVGKVIPGGAITKGIVGGAAGGVAGEFWENGPSMDGFMSGAGLGAAGGVIGVGASKFGMGKFLEKRKGALDEALTKAGEPKAAATSAAGAHSSADGALTVAQRELDTANQALTDANDRLADIRRLIRRNGSSKSLRRQEMDAKQAVRDATRKQADAQTARDDAVLTRDNELDNWIRRQGEADSAAAGLKKAEDALKNFDKRAEWLGKWGQPVLIGVGSAAVREAYNHFFSSDKGGGDTAPGGAAGNNIPLVWDGIKPANAAGVMGTEPFVQQTGVDAKSVPGGFLLRPEKLDPNLIEWYGGLKDSFASTFVANYELYGDLKKKKEIELKPVPTLAKRAAVQSTGGAAYKTAAEALDKTADQLTTQQETVVNALPKVKEVTATGQENIGLIIAGVNEWMQTRLQQGSDVEVINILGQGFSELAGQLKGDAEKNAEIAEEIAKKTAASDKAASEDLANSVGSYANQQQNPALNPDSSRIGVNNPYDPGNLPGYSNPPTTADLEDSTDKFKQQAEDLQKQADNALGIGKSPSTVDPASYNSNTPSYNPNTAGVGMNDPMSGLGGLFSQLPMMMASQAAMRGMNDSDMAGRFRDIDPSRYDRAAAPTMPQATPPAGTTPWSNQAAAATNANNAAAAATPAQPAHNQAGPPNGVNSSQTGVGVPKRVAGEDGLVPYVLPDGRTQRIPLSAAQGLDSAFANKNGTDAKAAYQGTAAAWASNRDIGPATDPSQLTTGDVATWLWKPKSEPEQPALVPAATSGQPAAVVTVGGDTGDKAKPPKDKPDTGSGDEPEYRTAIVVAFGNGESGTLEVVVAGELREYTPEMSDTEGDFGEFAGFKHPKGLEAAGDKGQETMQTSTDQTAADVPALTAPV